MKNDHTNLKLLFWINLWEDLINNFLKKSFGLNLYNPHNIIEEIITEIEENSFKNQENIKFFQNKINGYSKNDSVIKKEFYSSFKLLASNFHIDRKRYILNLCTEIKQDFEAGKYFDGTLQTIINLIIEDSEIDEKFITEIDYSTQSLIVEFIKKGYVLKEIKPFLQHIFKNYPSQYNAKYFNYFPHIINQDLYQIENKFNEAQHQKTVDDYLLSLSLSDRIEKLSDFYYKETKKVKYIFYIEGIKGQVDATFGDVNIYSLDRKKHISKFLIDESEEDLQEHLGIRKFTQVAVEVDYLSPYSSLKVAIDKVEQIIDIISCYFNIKTNLIINSDKFLIVDNGTCIFLSSTRNESNHIIKISDSLNSDNIEFFKKIDKYNLIWSNKSSSTCNKILNALHWFRKAENSSKDEDKILNYWIAIENLFNSGIDIKVDIFNNNKKSKFNLIQEIVASVQSSYYVYEYGWELYFHYRDNNEFLPNELIIKAQLSYNNEIVNLNNFIQVLPEIIEYEKNIFYSEKIKNTINFYASQSTTKKQIEDYTGKVKEDILLIYRFRNLIVHNAHFDNTLLPYFVWKIKDYSRGLIIKTMNQYSGQKDISDILLKIFLDAEKLLIDIEKNKENLFDLQTFKSI